MLLRSKYNMLIIPPRGIDDFVVYVDEVGQDGGKGNFGVVLLFLPASRVHLLSGLTSRVIADVKQREPAVQKVKAEQWSEQHRLELCDLVRQHGWPVQPEMRNMGHPDWDAPSISREKLFDRLEEDGHVLGHDVVDVPLLRRLFKKHNRYVDQLYDGLKTVVEDVANSGVVMRSCRIIAHHKVPEMLNNAVRFLAFVWLSRRFGHYLKAAQVGALRNVLSFESVYETEQPNLISADSIAHWWGMLHKDEKYVPGGRAKYRAYFERMHKDWVPAPILLKRPVPR